MGGIRLNSEEHETDVDVRNIYLRRETQLRSR